MIVPVPLDAVNITLTSVVLDTTTTPIVGEFGFVVTTVVALDDIDVPPELVAETVNVYGVFDINPDTVIGDDVPVPVKPPGLLVTI